MTKPRRLCIFAATVILTATASSLGVLAQTDKSITTLSDGSLKVCLNPDGAPVAEKLDDGSWSGWDIDYLTGFAESLGLRFEPVTVEEFSSSWRKPGEGTCDISGGGITYTAERAQETPDGVWSDPYIATKRSFIVRDGEEESLKGVADLANRTVLVWSSSTGALDLRRRIEKEGVADVTLRDPGTTLDALKMVRDGLAFGFDSDLTIARDHVARYPGLALAWIHPMMSADGSEADEVYAYIVRKANTGLVEALNAYIAANRNTYGWPP
jgi:ABC-type amino acid transport substrate-binding protein